MRPDIHTAGATFNPNVVAIIQARMGSTRLPGKVLMEIGGATVLARVIGRLARSERISRVVVATTDSALDDEIVSAARGSGAECFRGSEQDVLSRYVGAAEASNADWVVRVTSDCPLIDSGIVDRVIAAACENGADFASNCIHRSYPRGLDAEVFSITSLRTAERLSDRPHQREHVTSIFYERPDLFRVQSVRGERDYSRYRWTLDTVEDMNLIRAIYAAFQDRDNVSWRDAVYLMERQPELAELNAHIVQKAVAS
jgi:spore coat polysaccharide biosynthesis protein SpsF